MTVETRPDEGTDLRELRIHVCENCIARQPGTCHVPGCFYIRHSVDEVPTYLEYYSAASQDHAAAVRLAQAARASLDYTSTDAGRTRLRHNLDRAARVFEVKAEGEPPAPEPQEPPRFERGFYRLSRDLDDGTGVIPAGTEIVVHGPFDDGVWFAVVGSLNAGPISAAALAAAGAERIENGS